MFYLKAFLNSLYNLSWIRSQKNNGKQAANYIVLFVIVLSLGYAGYFTRLIPGQLETLSEQAFEVVPDFKAQIADGALRVENIDQPYVYEQKDGDESFKFVLDTVSTNTPQIEDVRNPDFDTTILITQKQIAIIQEGQGKTTIQSFGDAEDATFTKTDLRNVVDSFIHNTTLFFVILLIVFFVGFAFARVVYLLFIALIVFGIAKIFSKEVWKFSQVYTVGLYALTLPSLIMIVLGLLDARVPYLYSLILVGILCGVVCGATQEPQPDIQNENPTQASQ